MLDLLQSVEAQHRAIADAETDEEYDRALRGLKRALDRLTRRIDEHLREVDSRDRSGRPSRF